MTWRHTETVALPGAETCRECFADARHCYQATPDSTSPCHSCQRDGETHDREVYIAPLGHDHRPTLCTCGHPIEEAPR